MQTVPKVVSLLTKKVLIKCNANTLLPRKKLVLGTNRLYNILTTQIDYKQFFNDLKLSDTLYSWYSVTSLHTWMIFVRLRVDVPLCPITGQALQDRSIMRRVLTAALWQDLESKIKLMGVRGKQKKDAFHDIWGHYQFCHFDYDSGLLGSDKELAASLWRIFFLNSTDYHLDGKDFKTNNIISFEKEDPTQRLVCLINYVRKTVSYLDSLDLEKDILTGSIELPKLS